MTRWAQIRYGCNDEIKKNSWPCREPNPGNPSYSQSLYLQLSSTFVLFFWREKNPKDSKSGLIPPHGWTSCIRQQDRNTESCFISEEPPLPTLAGNVIISLNSPRPLCLQPSFAVSSQLTTLTSVATMSPWRRTHSESKALVFNTFLILFM